MSLDELTKEEIFVAKVDFGMTFGHPTFSDGWESALAFAHLVEKCHSRCHVCKRPIVLPWKKESERPLPKHIGVYGGDISGEIDFCKECWSKLSDDDKKKMRQELKPKY